MGISEYVSPFLLHSAAAGIMVWGFNALNSLPVTEFIDDQYAGHWQFLTIQGLLLSFLTMSISALNDLFPDSTGLKTLKRSILMVAMPVEAVVASIYWPLILLLPQYMVQHAEDPTADSRVTEMIKLIMIPLPIDLALHAVPAVSLLLDFTLFEKKFGPDALRYAIPLVFACTMGYSAWAEWCATMNGHFPYPFLTENPFHIRVAIYLGAAGIAYGSLRLVNRLHG